MTFRMPGSGHVASIRLFLLLVRRCGSKALENRAGAAKLARAGACVILACAVPRAAVPCLGLVACEELLAGVLGLISINLLYLSRAAARSHPHDLPSVVAANAVPMCLSCFVVSVFGSSGVFLVLFRGAGPTLRVGMMMCRSLSVCVCVCVCVLACCVLCARFLSCLFLCAHPVSCVSVVVVFSEVWPG